jgi:hypothetical protein
VLADRVRDRRDVGLVERAAERRAAVSARPEADELSRIAHVELSFVVVPLEAGEGDQRRGVVIIRDLRPTNRARA